MSAETTLDRVASLIRRYADLRTAPGQIGDADLRWIAHEAAAVEGWARDAQENARTVLEARARKARG